jgi:hypothetical protein
VGVPSRQVGPDASDDLIILEEAIELGQLGLEVQAELREQGEQIDGVVTIAEHRHDLE